MVDRYRTLLATTGECFVYSSTQAKFIKIDQAIKLVLTNFKELVTNRTPFLSRMQLS